MKNKKDLYSLIYRIVLFSLCVLGAINTLQVRIKAFGGDGLPLLLHFTTWTAWICLISSLLGLTFNVISFFNKKDLFNTSIYKIIKISADAMAIVTFIIAAFILPEKIWTQEYWTYGWTIKHFLVPLLMVLETVLFFKKEIKVWEPICASAPMLLYGLYMIPRLLICRENNGGHIPESKWKQYYPYDFTNIDKNGGSPILFFGLIFGLAFLMIGIAYIYYFVCKKNNKTVKSSQ